MILCLETSTSVCSVALCSNEGAVAVRESSEGRSHASQLSVFIIELLSGASIEVADLEAIAVSKGPGSYTGLRIGVSTAKGIAYASSLPLLGIETTLSMFNGITQDLRDQYGTDETSLFIPMLDARRMEVYYSVFGPDGSVIKDISAEIINKDSFTDIPEEIRLVIFGDGAYKCSQVLERKNVVFAEDFTISAAFMYKPAYKAFNEKRFEDTAYFEPFYLKDFITSHPKKNILGR